MTKAELVALITHQTGVEKTAAEAVVEAFMRNIKETMIAGCVSIYEKKKKKKKNRR